MRKIKIEHKLLIILILILVVWRYLGILYYTYLGANLFSGVLLILTPYILLLIAINVLKL